MDKFLSSAQVIVPIFVAVFLGILSKRRNILSASDVAGLQQFVMKFGLPCLLFNSCFRSDIGGSSAGIALVLVPCMLLSALWAFSAGRRKFRYHNLPMLFAGQETGMLGIPLFMVLFGAENALYMGLLDIAQAVIALPTAAILSTDSGTASAKNILRKLFTSPLMVAIILGITLNLTGGAAWLDEVGIGAILTETTGFLAQPVSAIMIFCAGYNFSLSRENRSSIIRISAVHLAFMAALCIITQAALSLLPGTDALTRWSLILYCALPASYLAPTLGRSDEDFTMASGVCSLLTVVCLIFFCIIAVIA